MTLKEQGDYDSAIAAFEQALKIDPHNLEALNDLGLCLHESGELHKSLDCFRRAANLKPDSPATLTNLGLVLSSLGQFDSAIRHLRTALSHTPNQPEAHNNLGDALRSAGHYDEAELCFKKALELNPAFDLSRVNLSSVHLFRGRPDLAIEILHDAVNNPSCAGMALNNLGNAHAEMGNSRQAFECYKKAAQANPPSVSATHNYLYSLNFIEDATPQTILSEHLKWNRTVSRVNNPANRRVVADGRPLKIGFVSPDFRLHPVGRFFLPLIENLDPSLFQTYCYSDSAFPDELTSRIAKSAFRFETTFDLTHPKLARKIQDDGIDILVDLTLHMAGCRLECFAQKPAPIQLAWLGYCGTTGLSEITHRLTDPHLDPPGLHDSHYSEKNVYLPVCYWCYQPIVDSPAIEKDRRTGPITFGCLNNFSKVRDNTLDLWKTLMQRVPDSRLMLHAPQGASRDRIMDLWRRNHLDVGRLEFIGRTSIHEYLQAYNRIDVALDPFPYGGGTTTCDALWMGVPVATLVGDRAVSRAGLSLLTNVGLTEWIAHTPADYLRIAENLARDPETRLHHSRTLRDRMKNSPLMDAKRFAHYFESAMLSIVNSINTTQPSP
jgi:predicted O-linked N-acetylglucosamine transferase (SPINDLY family)